MHSSGRFDEIIGRVGLKYMNFILRFKTNDDLDLLTYFIVSFCTFSRQYREEPQLSFIMMN